MPVEVGAGLPAIQLSLPFFCHSAACRPGSPGIRVPRVLLLVPGKILIGLPGKLQEKVLLAKSAWLSECISGADKRQTCISVFCHKFDKCANVAIRRFKSVQIRLLRDTIDTRFSELVSQQDGVY